MRTSSTGTRALVAIVFAVALLVAACGDDSGGLGARFGDGGNGGGDAVDEAADIVTSFGDSTGTATVIVSDVTYTTTEPELCYILGDDVTFEGLGEGSDGSMAWLSVGRRYETEEELREFYDGSIAESVLELMLDENGVFEEVFVSVNVDKLDSSPAGVDDRPEFRVTLSPQTPSGELEWNLDGNTFTGSGQVKRDRNDDGSSPDTVPISFEVSCG